jgi:ATP-dependent RNA helicase SUPV3L1/SUV3
VINSDPAATEAAALADGVAIEPAAAVATDEIADAANATAVPAETVTPELSASHLPDVDFAPATALEAVAEAAAAPVAAAESVDAVPAAALSDQPVTEAAVPATPELVEVWRPGGRSDERRPRHDRSRYKGPDKTAATPEEGETSAADGEKRERHGRNRRDRHNDHHRPRSDAPAVTADGAEAVQARPHRRDQRNDRNDKGGGGRPPRDNNFKGDRNQERGRFDKRGRDGRKEDRGGAALRTFATSAAPRERDRPADPNSPFAKLAALKEQLAGGRKD